MMQQMKIADKAIAIAQAATGRKAGADNTICPKCGVACSHTPMEMHGFAMDALQEASNSQARDEEACRRANEAEADSGLDDDANLCVSFGPGPSAAVQTSAAEQEAALTKLRDAAAALGFALVPFIPNRAMRMAMDDEGWLWEDLLAAAEAVTEPEYERIATTREQVVDVLGQALPLPTPEWRFTRSEGGEVPAYSEAQLRQAQFEAILACDPLQEGTALRVARDALQFYADSDHFTLHQPDAWDTVSGEPQNFYEDESNTATVEDGSIAKAALAKITLSGGFAVSRAETAEAEAKQAKQLLRVLRIQLLSASKLLSSSEDHSSLPAKLAAAAKWPLGAQVFTCDPTTQLLEQATK